MNTRTIDILLEIMTDNELVMRRRIQAAEAVLGFEAPTDAVNRAREYANKYSGRTRHDAAQSSSKNQERCLVGSRIPESGGELSQRKS